MTKELLFIAFFTFFSLLTGRTLMTLTHSETDIFSDFSWGVTTLFALFHILAYPLFIFKAKFNILLYAYGAVLGLIFTISAVILFHSSRGHFRTGKNRIAEFLGRIKKYPLLTVLALVFLALQVYTCIFCYHPSSDDGYYLARSMEVIDTNCLDIHPSTSWYGEEISNYADLTDASTLAFFISWFSRVFRLSPTILCRRGFALIMIIAHVSALITVLKKLCGWKGDELYRKTAFCLILYSFFQLKADKVCSAGKWLTDYIWQGKAILIALIFPMLLCACCDLINSLTADEKLHGKWFLAAITLTAGVSVSTVGLFIPAILFFTYGMAFLIATKFRTTKKVLLPAVAVLIPVIICAAISYFTIATKNTRYFEIGKNAQWSWKQQFLRANDIFQILLYIAGSIYIFFHSKKLLQRTLLILSPVILFATFLNPFFAGPVSTYVTTAEVYWRLFWMLPVYLVPSLAITEAADQLLEGKLQRGIVCCGAVLVILWGFVSQNYYIVNPKLSFFSGFLGLSDQRRENPYGISETSYEIAKAVLDDYDGSSRPKLLTKYDTYFEIRQYSDNIITFWEGQETTIPDTDILQKDFFNDYDNSEDPEYLYSMLKKLDADYVCIQADACSPTFPSSGLCEITSVNGIKLFKTTS